ncbi:MAG: 3'-5' exonuclease [Burkholderiaceae bacterium]|nr:3'-5' exonuclease [Burkholderiaceae bacterium]
MRGRPYPGAGLPVSLAGWLGSRWRRGLRAGSGELEQPARWVVVDVETSGLDANLDVLLSIGAIAVQGDRIVVADSLELGVRPERTSSRPNILVHGIGEQAQREGVAPGEACDRFLAYLGRSPLVAFHAGFDRGFLQRALRDHRHTTLRNPWIDLAALAPALHPRAPARSLDAWLAHFQIDVEQRHQAISDALASAMLFQRLLAGLPASERHLAALQRLCDQGRWLGGQA